MINNNIRLDDVIQLLNDLIKIDPKAIEDLIEQRVECSEELADHPTFQVNIYDGEHPKIGLLGVLNGLFGTNEEGWGPIAAVFNDEKKLIKFERTRQTLPKEED